VDSLAGLAQKYRDTPMAGRSNLQQAVPLTFGYKAAVWLAGFHRQIERLDQMKARILMGEFGGAVGTLASLGEKGLAVQEGMMKELGLLQPPIAWHTVRDTTRRGRVGRLQYHAAEAKSHLMCLYHCLQ
jgi:3-carboxy-cis,cis-muconate cycloisomerase